LCGKKRGKSCVSNLQRSVALKLKKTMKDLGLFNMKCDSEEELSSTEISEARYVAISLSDWEWRRRMC